MSNQKSKPDNGLANKKNSGQKNLYDPFEKGYQPVMTTIDIKNPPTDGTGVPEKIEVTQVSEKPVEKK